MAPQIRDVNDWCSKNIASYWYDCAEWGTARDNSETWKYQAEIIVCHALYIIEFNRFWLFDNADDFSLFMLTWG